jgi:hypothetical protein
MKKTIAVIVLVILVGSTLTAAAPLKLQTLQGTLHWQHVNVCGVSDFVPLPVMTNAYLTGNFAPTHGLVQGCHIAAIGYYYNTGACYYFAVDEYAISCTQARGGGKR